MNTVICPHCGKKIEISQVLAAQVRQELELKLSSQHKQQLQEAIQKAEEKARMKASEQAEMLLKDKENEAEEAKKRNKDLQEQLLQKTKAMRELKEKDESRELELEKKLASEEEKIRLDAQKKAEEDQHLKIAEKDKQLQDVMKLNEELKHKLQQGSQQLQGEVFEQEFEELLRREFPNDTISEVAKGVRGGDIIQEVWDRNGNSCGKILWELKNTKTWSELWIDKLKTDQRAIAADFAVIISEAVPPGVESAKFYKNLWITKRSFVVGLACSLRINLIQLTGAKRSAQGNREKKDIVYSYLSSTEFKHRVEAIIEAFSRMQGEIEKEKRYFNNKWARDEKNIRQVIDNTYGMHGDLKGIMGNVLPQVTDIELLADGTENS